MPVITTGDGVRLTLVEKGSGRPLVLVPGWSQTARQFEAQVEGAGRPLPGPRRRHAWPRPIREAAARLQDPATRPGSQERPGCARPGGRRRRRPLDGQCRDVVLLGSVLRRPPDPQRRLHRPDAGDHRDAVLDRGGKAGRGRDLRPRQHAGHDRDPGRSAGRRDDGGLHRGHVHAGLPAGQGRRGGRAQPADGPRALAVALLYIHATQDWRDVIPRMHWRTLVVGGKASFVSWQSQKWIHEQIPGSRLELFGADEGGQHFMFMENPAKFNALVKGFLG